MLLIATQFTLRSLDCCEQLQFLYHGPAHSWLTVLKELHTVQQECGLPGSQHASCVLPTSGWDGDSWNLACDCTDSSAGAITSSLFGFAGMSLIHRLELHLQTTSISDHALPSNTTHWSNDAHLQVMHHKQPPAGWHCHTRCCKIALGAVKH